MSNTGCPGKPNGFADNTIQTESSGYGGSLQCNIGQQERSSRGSCSQSSSSDTPPTLTQESSTASGSNWHQRYLPHSISSSKVWHWINGKDEKKKPTLYDELERVEEQRRNAEMVKAANQEANKRIAAMEEEERRRETEWKESWKKEAEKREAQRKKDEEESLRKKEERERRRKDREDSRRKKRESRENQMNPEVKVPGKENVHGQGTGWRQHAAADMDKSDTLPNEEKKQGSVGSEETEEKPNEEKIDPVKEKELLELKQRIGEERRKMRQAEAEAKEKIRLLHQQSRAAANSMGQRNAVMLSKAVGKIYERGVKDGMTYVKQMLENARSKDNAIVVVHDGGNTSFNISERLGGIFQAKNYIVPPFVRVNEELPNCSNKCLLKGLVMYCVLTEDRSKIQMRSYLEKFSRYLRNEAFGDCSKLLVIQTGSLPSDCDLEVLILPQKSTAIMTTMPDFHNKVVEKAITGNEIFSELVENLKRNSKTRQSCVVIEW